MRINTLKKKLHQGKPAFGTWLTLADEYVTRILARRAFDWLTVDLEHAAVDWKTAGALVGWIAEAGSVPLVRVPENNAGHIKRALDLGAYGLIIPMVNTPEEAASAVRAAKYPPVGDRSAGRGMQTLTFQASFQEYLSQANDAIFIAAQMESYRAVQHAAAIAAVPGIDALFIGPNDLRLRLSEPGRPAPTDAFDAAVGQVLSAARAAGCAAGIHAADAEEARRYADQGMTFIAVASDLAMLEAEADRRLRILRSPNQARDSAS
ncbi:MAG: HpcH/HpaI aldolase family protein [Thermogutta sp.]